MVSGRPTFKLLALSIVLILVLAACVRPLSQSDDAVTAEATATAEAEEASEEGAMEDAGSTDDAASSADDAASEEDTTEGGATEEDATEGGDGTGESEEGSAEESGDAGASDEESTGTEDEATEDTAGEAEGGDENVGGGAPDTAEDEAAEGVDEAAGAEAGSDETATGEEAAAQSPVPVPATHTVAAGENLYRIGLKYGMSWVVLAQYNNIPNPNRIYVGQVLQIPGGQPPPSQPPPSQPPPQSPEYTSYVVKPGDNLYRIGLAFGVSWVDIAAANGIVNPNYIYAGQVLKIPTKSPGQSPQLTHTVQQGETLFRISLRYGVSWVAIAQANNISSPYVIYPGQTLIIPSG